MNVRSLRRYLLEGLAVIGPVGLSVWVLAWLFVRMDRIFKTVLGEGRMAFQEVVAFQWPEDQRWAMGFVTGSPPDRIRARLGNDAVTIYMPTAPNPASGYLVMMAREDLVSLDVSVEEALTYVLSAGSVTVDEDPPSTSNISPP